METKIEIGQTWHYEFSFSQEQVNDFAKVTGDDNPLHLDPVYAAQTAFKKPIIHGMLGACVFSKVFGTIFPGPKIIYISQSLEFKKALVTDTIYRAEFLVIDGGQEKKRFKVRTTIVSPENNEILTDGEAWLRVR
jgi:acyl dehydratase